MAYTAQQLVTRSWYLSGLVARELEEVSGAQMRDGLQLLNDVLNIATSNIGLIPYYQEYVFPTVKGQEKYSIPGLTMIETLTFNIDTIRYPTDNQTREQYFGTGRADTIESLPFSWHIERTPTGADLYLYFLPSDVYTIKIWGKFTLSNVLPATDLSLSFQPFYMEYLRYKLAEYMCEFYNEPFPMGKQKRLASYEQTLRNVSPTDFTLKKLSAFDANDPFNYGSINIGKGFVPIGR